MNRKLILGLVLVVAALIFSVQNAAVVDVRILAWSFSVSLALVIFAALAIGLIGGWAVTSALRRKRGMPESPASARELLEQPPDDRR